MNLSKIISALRRVAGWLARPLVEELPLIVIGAVALTPCTYIAWYWCNENGQDFSTEVLPGAWHATSAAVFFSYLLAALVCWLPARRVIRIVAYVLMWVAAALGRFLVYNFKSLLTPAMLSATLETTSGESQEFLRTFATASGTIQTAKTMFFYVLVMAAALWLRPKLAAWLNRRWCKVVLLLLAAPFLVHGAQKAWIAVRPTTNINTFDAANDIAQDFVSTTVCSVRCVSMMRHEMELALGNALHVDDPTIATDSTFASTTVVFVLGESFNKHHAALYGYRLPTTPRMCAERDSGALTVFTDIISPYNTTSITAKNMFSCSSLGHDEHWWQQPMFTAVFRQAGYPVYFWDIQRNFNMEGNVSSYALNAYLFDQRVSQALYNAINTSTFDYDGQLVDDYFDQHPDGGGHALVILHIWGQHIWYKRRFPEEQTRFTIADYACRNESWLDEEMRQIIADYDNATLYNDAVMGQIFDRYADTDAVVVMLSDHGEEVYDYRDQLARDHQAWQEPEAVANENEIPLVVWCSPIYRQRHPQVVERLQHAAQQRLMNDDVCQLLFPLAGITTRYSIDTRNPLSPTYKPGKRIIYDRVDYDELMQGKKP